MCVWIMNTYLVFLFLLLLQHSLVVDIFGEVSDQALPLLIRVFDKSDFKVFKVFIAIFIMSKFKILNFFKGSSTRLISSFTTKFRKIWIGFSVNLISNLKFVTVSFVICLWCPPSLRIPWKMTWFIAYAWEKANCQNFKLSQFVTTSFNDLEENHFISHKLVTLDLFSTCRPPASCTLSKELHEASLNHQPEHARQVEEDGQDKQI